MHPEGLNRHNVHAARGGNVPPIPGRQALPPILSTMYVKTGPPCFCMQRGTDAIEVSGAGRIITLHANDPTASDLFLIGLTSAIRDSCGYVVAGGYVAALFGREDGCREAEILLPHLSPSLFLDVLAGVRAAGFAVMTPGGYDELFRVVRGPGIRITPGDGFFPNALVRCLHHEAEEYAYLHRRHLRFGPHRLFIAPPEILIPLLLRPATTDGTHEDAMYLYALLADHLSNRDLMAWLRHLDVTEEAATAGIMTRP